MTASDTGTSGAVQAAIERLRRDVLAGSGPGGSGAAWLAATRGRPQIGGRSVPWLREQVALGAAAARRDPDGLALRVVGERTRLGDDLDALVPRLGPALAGQARSSFRQALLVLAVVPVALAVRLFRQSRRH